MENYYLGVGLGIICLVIGSIWIIKIAIAAYRGKILQGKIIDRKLAYEGFYYMLIEYEYQGNTQRFNSSHTSIFQKIGNKIHVIYDSKKNRVIGTLGSCFFIPTLVFIVGLIILVPTLLYYK